MRTCIICTALFENAQPNANVCGESCRMERERRRVMERYNTNLIEMRALQVRQKRERFALRWKLILQHFGDRCSKSVDRRDPSKGYTRENVQLVRAGINIAKNASNQEDFIAMCMAVADYQRSMG